jgi:phosphatidylglycerophosphate synthase
MRLAFHNLPNYLSLSRIPIAATFLVLFDDRDITRFGCSLGLLALAALTDFLDGRLARAFRLSSRTGYFIDGLGDKAVYIAILLVIYREDANQYILPWLLILREIVLYALRVIEPVSSDTLRELRKLSLAYALLIRLYFVGFFLAAALKIFRTEVHFVGKWYIVIGLIAAITGYAHLYIQFKQMGKLPCTR